MSTVEGSAYNDGDQGDNEANHVIHLSLSVFLMPWSVSRTAYIVEGVGHEGHRPCREGHWGKVSYGIREYAEEGNRRKAAVPAISATKKAKEMQMVAVRRFLGVSWKAIVGCGGDVYNKGIKVEKEQEEDKE